MVLISTKNSLFNTTFAEEWISLVAMAYDIKIQQD